MKQKISYGCVVECTTDLNNYEDHIRAALKTLVKTCLGFVDKVERGEVTEQDCGAVRNQILISEIITTDLCLAMASGLHSNWGDSEFDAHSLKAKLEHRIKEHSPNNPKVRARVKALTNGICAYCGGRLGDDFHIEHVVSKTSGGPDHIANYVPSCKSCNSRKSTLHVLEFIKKNGGGR